jgi:hypothetical protein
MSSAELTKQGVPGRMPGKRGPAEDGFRPARCLYWSRHGGICLVGKEYVIIHGPVFEPDLSAWKG